MYLSRLLKPLGVKVTRLAYGIPVGGDLNTPMKSPCSGPWKAGRSCKGGRPMAGKENTKTIAQNKKAFHDYFVEESFEAGIELVGTEVKSLRQGRCNLKDAWCSVVTGRCF